MQDNRVLIVDDSTVTCQLLRKVITGLPDTVIIMDNYDDAARYCVEHQVDFLVTDCHLDHYHIAEELLKACLSNPINQDTHFYLMTSDLPDNFHALRQQFNIHGCLIKPISPKHFRHFIEQLLGKSVHR